MKKRNLLLGTIMCLSVQFVNAQTNTFPTSGNVSLNGALNAPSPLTIGYNNGDSQLGFQRDSGSATNFRIGVSATNTAVFKNASGGGGYDFQSNIGGNGTISAMVINGNKGNVGIGTTNPSDKLEVVGALRISGLDSSTTWRLVSNADGSFSIKDSTFGSFFNLYGSGSSNVNLLNLKNGKIGIGTTNPSDKLEIVGALRISGSDSSTAWRLVSGTDGSFSIKDSTFGSFFNLYGSGSSNVNLLNLKDGKIGIGTTAPDSKLSVEGKIHCREVLVDTEAFADYVFKENYNLKPLKEIEGYIKKEGHLEGFKSEKEIIEEGLNLKKVTIKQQEKIEELTLYIIELNKRLERLENK